jgi:hypothetical protein
MHDTALTPAIAALLCGACLCCIRGWRTDVGEVDGSGLGEEEGIELGESLGQDDGMALGWLVGLFVGVEGSTVGGRVVGLIVLRRVGHSDGDTDG